MGFSTDRVDLKFNWVRAALKFKQSRNKSEQGAIKSFGLRCARKRVVEGTFSTIQPNNNKNNDQADFPKEFYAHLLSTAHAINYAD